MARQPEPPSAERAIGQTRSTRPTSSPRHQRGEMVSNLLNVSADWKLPEPNVAFASQSFALTLTYLVGVRPDSGTQHVRMHGEMKLCSDLQA
jgi:hypothetical protein